MTIYFNLVCWSCGKKRGVEASRHPEFAFEVAQMVDALGMKGVLDIDHHRSLVFCDEACAAVQRKKDGSYRLRPLKIKEES